MHLTSLSAQYSFPFVSQMLIPSLILHFTVVSVPESFSPSLLIRPLESRDFWPKYKTKIISLPSELIRQLIGSGKTLRGDTGEQPSWVYKELHFTRWNTYFVLYQRRYLLGHIKPPSSGQDMFDWDCDWWVVSVTNMWGLFKKKLIPHEYLARKIQC